MIRKRAEKDTVNPPGQILYTPTLHKSIEEWKKYEKSRNAVEYQCPQCGTVYFQEQECDWCPGVIAKERTDVRLR